MSAEDLRIGQQYKAVLGDCCIEGEFTAAVTGMPHDDDGLVQVEFSNGVVLTTAWGVTFEPVPGPSSQHQDA